LSQQPAAPDATASAAQSDTEVGLAASGDPPIAVEERCLNCSAVLNGEYCARCGQHTKHHVHSTPKMIGEFVEDLFHADHRVWRTLVPLLFNPGWLTLEYLRGKRATYTPPFRLYIVLSLLFFLTASLFDTRLNVVTPAARTTPPAATTAPAADGIDAEVDKRLEEMLARVPEEEREQLRLKLREVLRELPVEQKPKAAMGLEDACTKAEGPVPDLMAWLAGREKVVAACHNIAADYGQTFSRALWDHVPQMMFFFVPLIALMAKLLYLGSRRYYAEHVLFFVHFHAFSFLAMTIRNVVSWPFSWFDGAWAGVLPSLLTMALMFYTPWYLFRAMRCVYAQGRFVTASKFVLLSGAYVVCLLLTLIGLVIFTALTLE
jgi:Protein of unknown function (DUF3667)